MILIFFFIDCSLVFFKQFSNHVCIPDLSLEIKNLIKEFPELYLALISVTRTCLN